MAPAGARSTFSKAMFSPWNSLNRIFGVSLERLRKKLPRIDTVDVVRSWPHGIGLKVTERKPVLRIEKGGKFVEVDAKGVRFAIVSRAPKTVPALQLTVRRSAGPQRFGEDRLVRAAVRAAGIDAPSREKY